MTQPIEIGIGGLGRASDAVEAGTARSRGMGALSVKSKRAPHVCGNSWYTMGAAQGRLFPSTVMH